MDIAQLVERQIVVLNVAGSSPVIHPSPPPLPPGRQGLMGAVAGPSRTDSITASNLSPKVPLVA